MAVEIQRKFDLVLIRGLPGSGKSTMAKLFGLHGYRHFESDQFFELRGKYVYDPRNAKKAHEWCYNMVERTMRKGRQVVVSNTFVTVRDMQPYLALAKKALVIQANGKWKNTHGVTDQTVAKMASEWEPFVGHQMTVQHPGSADQDQAEWVTALLLAP